MKQYHFENTSEGIRCRNLKPEGKPEEWFNSDYGFTPLQHLTGFYICEGMLHEGKIYLLVRSMAGELWIVSPKP